MTHELNTDDTSTRSGNRRFAVLGVTAGLIGGGAIGLMATMPSITSAANDDTAAVVALQDDGGETTDEDTAEPTGRTERIRELLQALVDDQTISADQADAVASHMAEQVPERDGRRGGGKGFPGRGVGSNSIAEVLGVDAGTLRDELRAGNSIADVAEANGVEVQAVIDAMVAEASERLDSAVENERLTEDEAAEKLTELTERITDMVNGEQPVRS